MNRYINTEVSQQMMKLEQLGATVQVVAGKMVHVEFKLNDSFELAYVYNVNKNNKYFLERVKPYPLALKELETPADVFNIIAIDYLQCKNATNSHNINHFIDINKRLHYAVKAFEDLFLYYNVPAELMDDIDSSLQRIQKQIKHASTDCNRVFFDKEPDNL